MADETPIAKFAPAFRNIKLYRSGRIEYQGQSGWIAGATARIDASGSKRMLRDTREVFVMIEGPRVSISASLASKDHLKQKQARQFVAKVNQMAMQLAEREAAKEASAAPNSPPGASPVNDMLGQLERLGKLRDSGVLNEEEFQAQKEALLSSTPEVGHGQDTLETRNSRPGSGSS